MKASFWGRHRKIPTMAKHQKSQKDYDWLEDPFNDNKSEQDEFNAAKMSSGSKIAVGIGCLAVLIILVGLIAVSCSSIAALMGTGAI